MNLAELLAAAHTPKATTTENPAEVVTIQGAQATATSPEGVGAAMPLETLLAKISPRRMDTGVVVLPDGIKAVLTEGAITIWVHETPPRVHRFRWIAPDSPAPFGSETKYREVRIALPYLIVLAVFCAQPNGRLQLSNANECFFRVAPLKRLAEPLLYPALLNCSRFSPPEGRPLSWICTQHLKPTAAMRDPDSGQATLAGLEALRCCLLETGFNLSSEHHEGSSWFTASCAADRRIRTVEAWEAATAQDPLFVLEVPWLKTDHTLHQVAGRIFKNQQCHAHPVRTASALARIIFNHQPATPARA